MGILESLALIVSSLATTTFAANVLYLGTYALAIGGAVFASSLFAQKPAVPKPEDGSYNLKQNVPALPIVYGRVKKGGDYVFLEEENGYAHHIIVWCGRRIGGFITHYLHDEVVTLNGSGGVVSPDHFMKDGLNYVYIHSRLGLPAETAYPLVTSAFPSIWTSNHRGDGLASVMMRCSSVETELYMSMYPNQMPEHSAIGDGALLYDPRKDSTQSGGSGSHRWTNPSSWEFSNNLALMRLDHLAQPFGGKLGYARMHMPDWMNAANVADQFVTNRTGGSERRYHGGMWFRTNNDPVEVGRTLDEAGEMIVYERNDGKIGVHAGAFITPDIRLTQDHIFAIEVDKNKRKSSTVLAVRGRYVNTANHYNTEDAALYGDPYGELDETERTRTFDNAAIQSHNHCQRKQKLTYIRANARRVTISADYSAAKNCAYRRFIRVHYPSRGLVNATIEITSTVSLDLRNMRVSFSGIVVPENLYSFNAATEEGSPGNAIPPVVNAGVPVPTGSTVTLRTEVVAGGASAAFAVAQWTYVNDVFIYEFEWEPTSGSEPARSNYSAAGQTEVRSNYLADGAEYRFRLRIWANGTPSAWTAYQTLTATADPTPPAIVTGAGVTGGSGQASFSWTAPNSANYGGVRIYMNTTNSMTGATLVATEYGPPNIADGRVVTGLSAGTKYGFVVAINKSGTPAAAVATGSFSVT